MASSVSAGGSSKADCASLNCAYIVDKAAVSDKKWENAWGQPNNLLQK